MFTRAESNDPRPSIPPGNPTLPPTPQPPGIDPPMPPTINPPQPPGIDPPLPPTIVPGDDEGTHGYIMSEFVESILKDRTPLVNIACALNMNVAGIVAHDSALKDGETLKVPQFAMPLGT